MQYFIGYSSFSDESPFDPSLFVDLHKRLGADEVNAINERIIGVLNSREEKKDADDNSEQASAVEESVSNNREELPQDVCDETNKGTLIVDATACPRISVILQI